MHSHSRQGFGFVRYAHPHAGGLDVARVQHLHHLLALHSGKRALHCGARAAGILHTLGATSAAGSCRHVGRHQRGQVQQHQVQQTGTLACVTVLSRLGWKASPENSTRASLPKLRSRPTCQWVGQQGGVSELVGR